MTDLGNGGAQDDFDPMLHDGHWTACGTGGR